MSERSEEGASHVPRRYVVLMYGDEAAWPTMTAQERAQEMERHARFPQVCADHGAVVVGGEALQTEDTATTYRRRGDTIDITDGPYAETTEQLGGLYIVDAPDLDSVLKAIAHLPEYTFDIRPVNPNPGES